MIMHNRPTTRECIIALQQVTGNTNISNKTSLTQSYPGWNKRTVIAKAVMDKFGYGIDYGDNSLYFAEKPAEFARIARTYTQSYNDIVFRVCRIFMETFKIKFSQHVNITTPLYNEQNIIYRLNPNISDYTFLQFQTRLENDLDFAVKNPCTETLKLDTLKKWCDYIAMVKGIQIPKLQY